MRLPMRPILEQGRSPKASPAPAEATILECEDRVPAAAKWLSLERRAWYAGKESLPLLETGVARNYGLASMTKRRLTPLTPMRRRLSYIFHTDLLPLAWIHDWKLGPPWTT